MNPLVGIVILHYRNYNDSFSCIESVLRIQYQPYFVVVVDNNSEDGSLELLKKDFCKNDKVKFLAFKKNDGYAVGNNQGIDFAILNGAEYICILNNDTVVEDSFLSKMISFMLEKKEYGITSPLICDFYKNNSIQSAGANINLMTGKQKLLLSEEKVFNIKEGLVIDQADYLGGACLLIRKDIIYKVGHMPEYYFLFYEEADWCFLARNKGVKLACITDAKIYHKGSSTIRKVKGLSKYYLTRNSVLFERKYATNIQYVFFVIYTIMAEIYSRLIRRRSRCNIKAFFTGMFYHIPKE